MDLVKPRKFIGKISCHNIGLTVTVIIVSLVDNEFVKFYTSVHDASMNRGRYYRDFRFLLLVSSY